MLARFTFILTLALLYLPTTILSAHDAEDDAVFHIECPDDVTVDCDAEIWDLSGYGWAYVYGYGSPQPAGPPVVEYHLNNCNTGYITRTWTEYDYQGNPYSCTQTITVGGGGFNQYNIQWPPHYTTSDCNAHLDPDDLQPPYDYPTYDDVECSDIIMGYDDEVFDFGGGCKKILRTWKIIDWCAYNPNHPYGGGRWEYVQILKIMPSGNLVLDCPGDVMASAGANCSGTYVSIPPATGSGACNGSLKIKNNSPYATSNGPDASGHYPYGTTIVKFYVDDPCAGWKDCKMKVVVKDMKKPSPICYQGLSIGLMQNADGYYMDLDPKWFDKGSFDNCTPRSKLKFDIEPKRVTCDDVGTVQVKVYVTDEDGNTQYCNTHVVVDDNMGMCPVDTTTFTLAGAMTNAAGQPMDGFNIELMDPDQMVDMQESDVDGLFSFIDVMNSEDYMVVPGGRDGDPTLGVSTFDLLLMAKHLKGIHNIDDPAKMLACDADLNGEFDIVDVLLLKKMLLGYTTDISDFKVWRFVPTDLLNNNNAHDILNENFEEYWTKKDLYEDVLNIDFTAIKIGDINGSVQGLLSSTSNRESDRSFPLRMIENDGQIDFVSTKNIDISGLQLELNVGEENVEKFIPGLLNIDPASMNLSDESLFITWIESSRSGIEIKTGDVLFSLKAPGRSVEELELSQANLDPEIYSSGHTIYRLKLVTEESTADRKIGNVQVFPNPSTTNDDLSILSADLMIKNIEFFNSSGQKVHSVYDINQNEVRIPTGNLGEGLFFLQIKMENGQFQHEKLFLTTP